MKDASEINQDIYALKLTILQRLIDESKESLEKIKYYKGKKLYRDEKRQCLENEKKIKSIIKDILKENENIEDENTENEEYKKKIEECILAMKNVLMELHNFNKTLHLNDDFYFDLREKYKIKVKEYEDFFNSLVFDDIVDSEGNIYKVDDYYDARYHLVEFDAIERKSAYDSVVNVINNNVSSFYEKFLSINILFRKIDNNIMNLGVDYIYFIGFDDYKIYDIIVSKAKTKGCNNHKYYETRKRILNQEFIHYHEEHASSLDYYEFENYSYEQVKKILLKATYLFGEEYQQYLKSGLDNNWYDINSEKNEKNVSYCCMKRDYPHVYHYFLGKIMDVAVLGHEFGHAINDKYLMDNTIDYYWVKKNIVISESFATVNQFLTYEYLKDNEECLEKKIMILENMLRIYKSYTIDAFCKIEFTQWLQERCDYDNINIEEITNKYIELLNEYDGDSITDVEEVKYSWLLYIGHVDPFYMYKYCLATLIAICVIKKLKTEGKSYIQKFLNAIKVNSYECEDVLKVLEIDLDSDELIDNAYEYYLDLIDQYEECFNQYNKAKNYNI